MMLPDTWCNIALFPLLNLLMYMRKSLSLYGPGFIRPFRIQTQSETVVLVLILYPVNLTEDVTGIYKNVFSSFVCFFL